MKFKIIFLFAIFQLQLFGLSNNLLSLKYKDELHLNDAEIAYLQKNPTIKLAVMSFWPKDDNGGDIHYDLIDLLNKYGKLNIIPITFREWQNGYNQAKKGVDVQGILNLGWSYEREKSDFFFTKPYTYSPLYIITKPTRQNVQNFESLEEKTVYLVQNSTSQEIFSDSFFKTQVILKDSSDQLYKDFANSGEADAIATFEIDYKIIKQNDFKVVDTLYNKYAERSLGISKKNPELFSIIQKVIEAIPVNEFESLKNKNKLIFTQEEEKWLNTNQVVKYVYDPFYRPIEFKNEINLHDGIVKEIFDLITEKSNIHLEQLESIHREDSFELVKNGRVDFFTASVSSQSLKKDYIFSSNTLLSIPYVFVSNKDVKFPNGFKSLVGKKIGVLQNHQVENLVKQISNDLEFIPILGAQEAFEKLFAAEVDLLILDATTAKYYLDLNGNNDFEITYKTVFNQDLRIMFNKDVPKELVSVMEKSLQNIPRQDINDIVHKWTQVTPPQGTDWVFIGKITGGIILVLIVVFINNRQLKTLVGKRTKELHDQTKELENILNMFDRNVIVSKTDLEGVITYASDAFCKISGYKLDELIGQPHNIIRDPNMPKELFGIIWKSLKREIPVIKEIRNRRKDGSFYWVESKISPDYDLYGKLIGYIAISQDITDKKEVEDLKDNLEIKVEERTRDLDATKKEVEKILASILLPVMITDKETRNIVYANKYAQTQYDKPLEDILGSSVTELYTTQDQGEELVHMLQTQGFIENVEQHFITHSGKEFTALLSVIPITYKNRESYIGMTADITKQKMIEQEVRQMHKHTRDSIEYASLIQHAIVAEKEDLAKYFVDSFAHWEPKDVVGGDIWLFEQLSSDECILYCIDCTGHGVPGAFVTMLVKAIERQVSAFIHNNSFIDVSPAWILSYFNKTIKMLLKQETEDSISNAGFDGGIIYYNRKENILKFAGAETPLFYCDENGEFNTLKGSRHSVGYKKSDPNFEFKEYTIETKPGMKFYITTDGYLDQNGGEKDFPFGKKNFGKIIEQNKNLTFEEQRVLFMEELDKYQGDQDRNDDVTVIGLMT